MFNPTDTCVLTEYRGHPLIAYDMGEYQGKPNKPFQFGLSKAMKVLREPKQLLDFIEQEGSQDQRIELVGLLTGLVNAVQAFKDGGDAVDGPTPQSMGEDEAAEPSAPANPFAD